MDPAQQLVEHEALMHLMYAEKAILKGFKHLEEGRYLSAAFESKTVLEEATRARRVLVKAFKEYGKEER
jgi:hypothetical protein